jgi:hypothetical protein
MAARRPLPAAPAAISLKVTCNRRRLAVQRVCEVANDPAPSLRRVLPICFRFASSEKSRFAGKLKYLLILAD